MQTIQKHDFMKLPLDQQRIVIDWCIANRQISMTFEGQEYELPMMLQITYKCNNPQCNHVISSRFFRNTVINGNISKTRHCSENGCSGKMYISHKTSLLDYYLGDRKKSKEEPKGLMVFFQDILEEEMEQYGTIDDETNEL